MLGNFLTEESGQTSGEDFQKEVVTTGAKLFESKYKDRYPSLGKMFESDDAKDHYTAGMTSIIMRNQEIFMENVKRRYSESVIVSKLGDLAPRIQDIVRIFYPFKCYN